MSEVTRVFVEKKPGFDVEAKQMLWDLRHNLGLKQINGLRLLNRYDVSGLTKEQFEMAKKTVFSEPNQDNIYDEEFSYEDSSKVFAMEYLPGQYDQRADSAAQCTQLLTQQERPKVLSAKVVVLSGDISDEEFEKVKSYLVNPVESRVASMDKPESLDIPVTMPENVAVIEGFIGFDDEQMEEYYNSMGFAMTLSDLKFCRDYFKNDEQRDPTVTELRVIDTYWSDHCRHTTFLTRLENIEIEKGALTGVIEDALKAYYDAREELYGKDSTRDVSLMDMALCGMKLLKKRGLIPDLDESEEINACSIEVPVTIDGKTEKWLVQFKNETHNHPTEIEPFGGAATCLGGAIRDPLSGRAYVYQAMRVTGSGDPTIPFKDTMHGKLPTRKITTGAASGYSSYGNQIGLATGQVTELYDPGYAAKRLEIGAVIGASPKENVIREVPSPGDIIVLLGGATGRDGCGGATGSSKAHTEQSIETCGAEVQKGNPPTERKIQRLFRDKKVANMIKRCNDFGAGGVCVAIGELADGLDIDLDKVTKKYEGLDGTELAISESQERMAVVLDPNDVEKFIALAGDENLEATAVAVVSENPRLTMNWRGDTIVSLSREFLNTNGVTQTASAYITAPDPKKSYRTQVPKVLENRPLEEAFKLNLSRLEVCSQIGLSERFDASIGAATVNMPFGGKYQLTPTEAMAAKIPLEQGETDDATAMSFGYIPGTSRWSPFHGSAYAVLESMSKLLAIGANPLKARLTFQEYFERLHDKPERWGKPAAALLGAMTAQLEMGVPSIGGKDSMSGSFEQLDVPPTLVSFAVAMTKASKTISSEFKNVGSRVIYVPLPEDNKTAMPIWCQVKEMYQKVYELMEQGRVLSAGVVKEGGAAAQICKMCFGNKLGFKFDHELTAKELFAPLSGSLILEMADNDEADGFLYYNLGTTTEEPIIDTVSAKFDIDGLIGVWTSKLEKVFPTEAECPKISVKTELYTERSAKAPAIKTAKPTVFIPVFPGTNCEVDTARAFAKAGANPELLIVKNLKPSDIEQTIEEMEKIIRRAQIIMFPGGFSGGDEPDGSGKFIATTFRNPRIAQAVTDLLDTRDGLMLGICNGFQALIKLGLVPNGKITDIKDGNPTLTFNTIGRHISHMAYTRVTSVKSPWFSGVDAGEVFAVPISHGEGRFVASDETIKALAQNGQIATQYVDLSGNPSDSIKWNVNGSVCAIEGITSPDGRILGKMGHSERKGENLYSNVPFEKDQKLFESGVNYFK
ncbi:MULTISPECIES: phosphoribosylformylglycinamidine synthase [unclassified Ruminococcus]|uniref:phosphoribosylformylglycinamidine synthase n=1 Tax=unclassified Ruminococcus TaxID=2608920 RepID=UPI00210A03FB|nr:MULTISPECIES: phosphoribosylformylglycinamidine synthase [unclassified Ruminococcus]MCQ4023096.1 phosphoribosylformylglycinamidine synthase [Ruminococcus sp. zg-924]MCQ4115533.1 phosphoribosylformylglycinamidine synthase [Ruminococcus sp. zg-921]